MKRLRRSPVCVVLQLPAALFLAWSIARVHRQFSLYDNDGFAANGGDGGFGESSPPSPSHENGIEDDAVVGGSGAVVWFDEGGQRRQRRQQRGSDGDCRLLFDTLTYLDRGADGQVFSAAMDCRGADRRGVAFKAATTQPRGEADYQYVEEKNSTIRQMIDIHRTLLVDDDDGGGFDEARSHFAAPMATARVPVDVLCDAVNRSDDARGREILRTRRTGAAIAGTVMEKARGARLDRRTVGDMAPRELRGVAGDLVWMYRRMYERRCVHQDVSFDHLYYRGGNGGNGTATGVTSFVDFSRFVILQREGSLAASMQRMQLYQLLALLANVCTRLRRPELRIPNRVKLEINTTNVRELVTAMEECRFHGDGDGDDDGESDDDDHRRRWAQSHSTSSSTTTSLQLLLNAFETDATARAYEVLTRMTNV